MKKNYYSNRWRKPAIIPVAISRAMRMTAFLFFICALNVRAKSFSQDRLTLNLKDVKLSQVFTIIQQKTDYQFLYNTEDVQNAPDISISVKKATVPEILADCFKGYPLEYKINDKTVVVAKKAPSSPKSSELAEVMIAGNPSSLSNVFSGRLSAPDIIQRIEFVVRGKVSDENGNPLAGVSVTLKGNNTVGTTTNESGSYSITIENGNGVLVFSFVGHVAQEIPVNGRTAIDIIMQPSTSSLKDVVVVGYGTQKRGNLTGAVSQVGSEVLSNRPLTNLTQGLQGVLPNLNLTMIDGKPIQSPVYNIRGTTSIGQGGNALVLIDGVEGNPSMINPNDVASVTILKDAASASIYGARAAFGVVLITTKSAKTGKTVINYSSDYSIKKPTTVPDQVTNGYAYAQSFSESYSSRYNYTLLAQNINKTQKFSQAYLDELKRHDENPSLPKTEIDADGEYVYYHNTDWYDLLYKPNNFATSQNLSISGSNDRASFYITGRYFDQTGIFRYNSDDYKMANFRAKGTIKVFPWMSLSNSTYYSAMQYHNPLNVGEEGGIWANMSDEAHPTAPLLNPDGTLTYSAAYTVGDFYYGKNGIDFDNRTFSSTTELVAKFFNNHFRVHGNFTFQNLGQGSQRRRVPVPYSVKPGVIEYLGSGINDFQKTVTKTDYFSTNLFGEYENTFNDIHHFKVLLGYNFEQSALDNTVVSRNGLIFPDAENINLALGQSIFTSGDWNRWDIVGFFSRINYQFKERYLIELNGRYDGSSKFPKDQRFGFFSSASAGWIISNESFWYVSPKAISNFKLRASYGSLGNGNIDPYVFTENFLISQSAKVLNNVLPQQTGSPGLIPSGLTWETSTTQNIGMDLAFLDYRLTFNGDVYTRRTNNMFTVGPTLPDVLGTTVPKGNYANLKTNGWELVVGWNDEFKLGSSPFNYSVSLNMSHYSSTITKFNNPDKKLEDFYEGQKVGEIWGYISDGFWTESDVNKASGLMRNLSDRIPTWLPGDLKFKDLDDDGVVTHGNKTVSNPGDMRIIGNTTPRYAYGLNLNFSWNRISLSSFFQGIGRRDWYPSTESDNFWGQFNRPYNVELKSQVGNIWSEDNPNAYFPRLRGYLASSTERILGVPQTRYLQNAAYIRLKNIQLGYDLSEKIFSKRINNMRIYFSGENLWVWSPMFKYTGHNIDPESINGSENLVGPGNQGDGQNYPILKSFTLGINISL